MDRFWPLRRVGQFDTVWIARDNYNPEVEVFMKLIEIEYDNNYAHRNDQANLEAQTLQMLSELNPFRIVNFVAFYRNQESQYVLVTEKADCSVADVLRERPRLTEDEAKTVIRCVLEALVTTHKKLIVHRDIKPDNIMLFGDDLSMCKLSDYGICAEDNGYNSVGGRKGTPGYLAPEILKKLQYGRAVDIWSTGVTAYQILFQHLPFSPAVASKPSLIKKPTLFSSKPKLTFPDDVPISAEGKAFLTACLQDNPDDRPTAEKALNHPWFNTSTPPPMAPVAGQPIPREITPLPRRQSDGHPALIQYNYASPASLTPATPPQSHGILEEVAPVRQPTIRPESVQGFTGWLKLHPDNGDPPYFFHRDSNRTQWEHPSLTDAPQTEQQLDSPVEFQHSGEYRASPSLMSKSQDESVYSYTPVSTSLSQVVADNDDDDEEDDEIPLQKPKKKGVRFSETDVEVIEIEKREGGQDAATEGEELGEYSLQSRGEAVIDQSILSPPPLDHDEQPGQFKIPTRQASVSADTFPRPPPRGMSQSDDFLTEGSAGDVTRQSTVVTVTDGEVKGLNRVSTIPRKFVHVDSFRGAIVDDAEDGSVIVDGQVDGFHRVETASKEFERVHSVRADILDDTSEEVANADDETFDEVLENGFLQKSVVGANGWKMVAIPANTVYYYNAVTGVVQWSSPLGPSISNEIPPPPPPPEVRTPSPPPPPGPPPKSLILPTPPPKTASSYKFKPTVLSPKSTTPKRSSVDVKQAPPSSAPKAPAAKQTTESKTPGYMRGTASSSPITSRANSGPRQGSTSGPSSSRVGSISGAPLSATKKPTSLGVARPTSSPRASPTPRLSSSQTSPSSSLTKKAPVMSPSDSSATPPLTPAGEVASSISEKMKMKMFEKQ